MTQTTQTWKIGDCVELMREMGDASVDLVVTSPPYDGLRTYGGKSNFDFESSADQLVRIIKSGGVIVWIVGDQTIGGSETCNSFRQALYFKDIGMNLHDTMIYDKGYTAFYDPRNKRYKHRFEYMFIFSKGTPNTFNPIMDVPNKHKGVKTGSTGRNPNGSIRIFGDVSIGDYQCRGNIWTIDAGYMRSTPDKVAYNHPAIFPDNLAEDHIRSWSNMGDLVVDPFCGSGTVLKMCRLTNRNGIGFEINPDYEPIIRERCMADTPPLSAYFDGE